MISEEELVWCYFRWQSELRLLCLRPHPMAASSSETLDNTIFLFFVVEASFALGAQWIRIVGEYASPMLKRLGDANQGYKVSMLHCWWNAVEFLHISIASASLHMLLQIAFLRQSYAVGFSMMPFRFQRLSGRNLAS